MNTKIGTSFGLAMLMAIGVIAAMLAFGFFSPSKATADVDVEDITLSSATAGASGQIQIAFTTDNPLVAGSGQLIVTFDATWGVPSTIAKEHITITTSGSTGGTSNPTLDPTIVIGANSTVVTITVGDTNPSASDTQSLQASVNGTAATNDHYLTFSPLAAITNPTSQATNLTSWIALHTTTDATNLDVTPTTSAHMTTSSYTSWATVSLRAVSLSPTSGVNGTSITATGKGFVTGSLTAWIDTNTDGSIDSGEIVLGTSDSTVASGTATVTFTASIPTFGTGATSINLMDGNGNSDATVPTFSMLGSVTTSVTEAKRGQAITVKLRQFAAGDVTSITFGGSGATLPSTVTVPASGTLDLAITVPTSTSLGTQRVNVVAGETRNNSIDIIGAPMTLSPSTAVPLQTITISGSGFNGGATVSTITVGNFTVVAANIASGATVTADDSGNIVAQLKIPIDATDATTRTAGTYKITITDSAGRTGQADLVIPSRVVTLSPASSRRASTITVEGTGFPASTSVTVKYASTTVGSATPDSAGAFSTTITVPTTASIPSTNAVLVTSSADGAPTGSANHAVPGASITISESSAVSGEQITVTGEGFPGYATMTALTVGAVSAIPTPAPSTDIDGKFTTTVLVPQLASGTQAVLATIGGIAANSSISVTTAVAATVVVTQTTADVFADEVASGNLVIVWRLNTDQTWSFYREGEAFTIADNFMSEHDSGDIVQIKVVADTTFQGKDLVAGWTFHVLD